jgi:kinetochore protein Fta7
VRLLLTQIAKEERLLQQDKEELDELKRNARSGEALRKKQQRSLHPLAQALSVNSTDQRLDVHMHWGCPPPSPSSGKEVIVSPSTMPGMEPLLSQLTDHLESIRNNVLQVAPLAHAIGQAQDVLDNFSQDTLSKIHYHEV